MSCVYEHMRDLAIEVLEPLHTSLLEKQTAPLKSAIEVEPNAYSINE